jgi:hypothetical protein
MMSKAARRGNCHARGEIFFGLVCFGSGVAFAMDAVNALVHVGYAENMGVSFPAMFGAMCACYAMTILAATMMR